MIEMNMTPEEEAVSNAFGDKLAREVLGLEIDSAYSPDNQGRIRWKMPGGNKTGIGLLLTLERAFEEMVEQIDNPPKA
jgi:hypothetical protein